jgi:hypothetical protein
MPPCGRKFEYLFRGGRMKRRLISIGSFIIFLTLFAGNALAVDYPGDYTIRNVGDIAGLSSYTGVAGNLEISNTTLTSLTGLESITSVGGNLNIKV